MNISKHKHTYIIKQINKTMLKARACGTNENNKIKW